MTLYIGTPGPLRFKDRTPFTSESVNPYQCNAASGDLVVIFCASFNVGAYGTGPTPTDWIPLFNNAPFLLTGGGARTACQGVMKRVQGPDNTALQVQEAGLQAYLGEVLVFEGGNREPVNETWSFIPPAANAKLGVAPLIVWGCAFGIAPMSMDADPFGSDPTPPPVQAEFASTTLGTRGLNVQYRLFTETENPASYEFDANFSTAGGPNDGSCFAGYIIG